MTKVLSIGTDRKLFKDGSVVRQRQVKYAKLFEEVHIVVFSTKKDHQQNRIQIAENAWIYSTNSINRWFYIFDAVRLGRQIVRDWGEEDVVTCQDPFENGLVGLKIALKTRVKLHIQIHTDFLSPFFKRGGILNRVRIIFAYKVLPKAEAVRVVSHRIKDSLIKNKKLEIDESKIKVLPVFVDKEKIMNSSANFNLRNKYSQFDFIILSISRLSKEKNVSLGIKAFAKVIKKHPKTGLVIVGSGPEKENLKSLVKRLALEKNVIFESWTEDPLSYQKSADLIFLTSWYEGYGLTILESILAGTPVVSTDVGLASNLLSGENYSFVCKPGDASCLSEKTTLLREDEKFRKQLISDAQNKLRNQLLSREEYLEEYRKLI